MVYISWKMALACAVVLPLVVLPVGKFGRKIRRSGESSQNRLGELSQILQETTSGNRVVKAFGMEEFESRKFRDAAATIAARKHAVGAGRGGDCAADGLAGSGGGAAPAAVRARPDQGAL